MLLPTLSVGFGVEGGVPLSLQNNFKARANLYFLNNKGRLINIGYDTNETFWVGYTKMFKLVK